MSMILKKLEKISHHIRARNIFSQETVALGLDDRSAIYGIAHKH